MKRSPIAFVLSLPVHFYRRVISPMKPRTCRFHPTCSAYALDALRVHGACKGTWLTVRRLCRCHPFTEPGFDPVPPRRPATGRGELEATTRPPSAGTDRELLQER